MTKILERIVDVGGSPYAGRVTFSIPQIRRSANGDSVVVTTRHIFELNDGWLDAEVDSGPAVVHINGHPPYDIIVPQSDSAVALWPLIDAGLPGDPHDSATYIRSDGVMRRAEFMVKPVFDSLEMLDPSTIYFISDN